MIDAGLHPADVVAHDKENVGLLAFRFFRFRLYRPLFPALVPAILRLRDGGQHCRRQQRAGYEAERVSGDFRMRAHELTTPLLTLYLLTNGQDKATPGPLLMAKMKLSYCHAEAILIRRPTIITSFSW